MSEQRLVMDEPVVVDERDSALREATERAERAEAEVMRLKAGAAAAEGPADGGGVDALRRDSMMAYLLDSLDAGKDIGHYGRLVFAMVARHFLAHDELVAELTKDRDFSEEQARLMVRQVESKGYNPPKRARILEWQTQQEFPIVPMPEDPDCGNVYKDLKFPAGVYHHIEEYQVEKMEAEE